MQRKPLGSYFRSTPDWYAAKSAWGSGQVNTGSPNQISVSLYNNATDGSYLWVYGMRADLDDDAQLFALPMQGVLGSPFTNGFPLVAGNPTPFGQIFTDVTATPSDEINVPFTWQGGEPGPAPMDFNQPFCALPPTWSLMVYTGIAPAALLVCFFWTVLPAQT